jgi:ribosomal protein S18 acetylase RimI-like enzyme
LFTCGSSTDLAGAWAELWETARQELAAAGISLAAAISLQPWFEELISGSLFQINQSIIMLEWDDDPRPPVQPPAGVTLRPMRAHDLPAVAEVDASAFEPLWRNSLDALERAYPQSLYATVAEGPDGLLGYQLSTGNPRGAHLARLAVRREAQGTGIGRALVSDLIQRLGRIGRAHITVNTQSDNLTSQALYERMGFRPTGERYPVFVHSL